MSKIKKPRNLSGLMWANVLIFPILIVLAVFFKPNDDKYLKLVFYFEAIFFILFWTLIKEFGILTKLLAVLAAFLISLIMILQFAPIYLIIPDVKINGGFLLVFAYLLFLLMALGIIFAGIKSIVERKSFYNIGPGQTSETSGWSAIIWGIVYLVAGVGFLEFLLSLALRLICIETDRLCSISRFFIKWDSLLEKLLEKFPIINGGNLVIAILITGTIVGLIYRVFKKRA